MEVTVLGYKGKLRNGEDGFYVDFDNYEINQYHWTTTGIIAQKYGLLIDNEDPDSGAFWAPLFTKWNYDFGPVQYEDHRFPEFSSQEGLLLFISLINGGGIEQDQNFINLDYIV